MAYRISKVGLQNKLKNMHAFFLQHDQQAMAADIVRISEMVRIPFDQEFAPVENDDGEWEQFEKEKTEFDPFAGLMKALGINPELVGQPIMTENGIAIPVMISDDEDDTPKSNPGVEFIVDEKNLDRLRGLCNSIANSQYETSKALDKSNIEAILYVWMMDDGIQTLGDVMDMVAYIQKKIPEYVICFMGPSFVRDMHLSEAKAIDIEFFASKNDSQPFYKLYVEHTCKSHETCKN